MKKIIGVFVLLLAVLLICAAAGIFPRRQKTPQPAADQQLQTADGIRFEQSDELRGRMLRVMARRKEETSVPEGQEAIFLQKLYDSALLCFAEAARRVWPELDAGSLSGCLFFQDEAEQAEFMKKAGRLIGDRRIDKPEDITYWINKETLAGLLEQDRANDQDVVDQADH